VEVYTGFWVSGDLIGRGAGEPSAKTIMWISIFPIVLVAGLGGFVVFK
jgi:hypothetical protein